MIARGLHSHSTLGGGHDVGLVISDKLPGMEFSYLRCRLSGRGRDRGRESAMVSIFVV